MKRIKRNQSSWVKLKAWSQISGLAELWLQGNIHESEGERAAELRQQFVELCLFVVCFE